MRDGTVIDIGADVVIDGRHISFRNVLIYNRTDVAIRNQVGSGPFRSVRRSYEVAARAQGFESMDIRFARSPVSSTSANRSGVERIRHIDLTR